MQQTYLLLLLVRNDKIAFCFRDGGTAQSPTLKKTAGQFIASRDVLRSPTAAREEKARCVPVLEMLSPIDFTVYINHCRTSIYVMEVCSTLRLHAKTAAAKVAIVVPTMRRRVPIWQPR
jgi:hypothetical protein